MKLSCQEQLVPGVTFAEKVNFLDRAGFAGIELSSHEIATRITHIQQVMADTRLRVSALHGGSWRLLVSPNPEIADQTEQYLRGLLKYCSLLQCPGLIITSASPMLHGAGHAIVPKPAEDEEVERLADRLSGLAEAAEEYGVMLFIEPVNRYEGELLHTLEDAARVCRAVNRSSVQILANVFHMNIEEESFTISFSRCADKIGYVHLADSNRFAPGQGHIPFHELAIVYRQIQFDGYLSLECFVNGEEELLHAKRYLDRM